MTIPEFLALMDDYYRNAEGEYTKAQSDEIMKYLEIVEPCLLSPLWDALPKVPLYKNPRPVIEHLEIARKMALVAYERYADIRRAERATALLPDEPYLPREESAKKLHEIMQGLRAARHFGPKGGNLDRERDM
jgi:hypothetical protein